MAQRRNCLSQLRKRSTLLRSRYKSRLRRRFFLPGTVTRALKVSGSATAWFVLSLLSPSTWLVPGPAVSKICRPLATRLLVGAEQQAPRVAQAQATDQGVNARRQFAVVAARGPVAGAAFCGCPPSARGPARWSHRAAPSSHWAPAPPRTAVSAHPIGPRAVALAWRVGLAQARR